MYIKYEFFVVTQRYKITTQYYIMLLYVSRVLKIEDINASKQIFRVVH